jgi:lysophospholipase L1-like esterase
MAAGPWVATSGHNILLLGDSIVWGGKKIADCDRLGSILEKSMPVACRVWPVAAPSWGVLNEIAFADRVPAVVEECKTVVWVVNSGDFSYKSQWLSGTTHPRCRPGSAVTYVSRKYLTRWQRGVATHDTVAAAQRTVLPGSVSTFADSVKKFAERQRVLVVLYPDKNELEETYDSAWKSVVKEVYKKFPASVTVLDLRDCPEWQKGLYLDNVHPSLEGIRTLAALIVASLTSRC